MKQILKICTLTSLLLCALLFATSLASANEEGRGNPNPEAPPSEGRPGDGRPGEGRPGEGRPGGRENKPRAIHGTVVTITAEYLTLHTNHTRTVTVTLSASTTVRLLETGTSGSLSDIVVGDRVHVHGKRAGVETVAAKVIVVEPDGDHVRGKVTAVNGPIITLETHKRNARARHSGVVTATFTVTTTDLTKFRIMTATATLSDVVVGKHILAYGTVQGEKALNATLVIIGKKNDHRPGHGGPGQGKRPANILDRKAIKAAIAEALGLTVEELDAAREAGKSLAELAEQQGVTLDSVAEAAKAEAIAQINQAVADGKLTQAEADEWIARINNSDFPNLGGGRGSERGHLDTREEADDLADTDGVTSLSSAAAEVINFAVNVYFPAVLK